MEDYIIIAILGALVALDTTVAGQFMISQPLVSASLAGYFLGDLQSGIYIGAIMQLMWLKLIPAGGSIFLNGNLGTLAAISVLGLSFKEFQYSIESLRFTVIVYGILTSYIFGYFTTSQRYFNQFLIRIAHNAVDKNRILWFQLAHILGVIITGVAGMFIAVIFALAGKWLLFRIPPVYFISLAPFFQYGLYAFLGIGIGTVFSMLWARKAWYYPVIGVGAGCVILLLS